MYQLVSATIGRAELVESESSRLRSYKQLVNTQDIDDDRNEYLCVVCACLYQLEHSTQDLSLREYASQRLRWFLQQRPSHQR